MAKPTPTRGLLRSFRAVGSSSAATFCSPAGRSSTSIGRPNRDQQLAIGFADLSTGAAQALSTAGDGGLAVRGCRADIVTDHGARVIKLIGDEVMYSAATRSPLPDRRRSDGTAARACSPAAGTCRHRRRRRMVRDGDCFGPVVNLAARAVKLARPSAVVVAAEVAAAAGDTFGLTLLVRCLKGLTAVSLFEIDA